jgi:hypothetical protein
MEDIEIVRKCAEMMGYKLEPYSKGIRLRGEDGYVCMVIGDSPIAKQYDPLHDKAQAMDLVIKFEIAITPRDILKNKMLWTACYSPSAWHEDTDLLRAICECVANIKGKT